MTETEFCFVNNAVTAANAETLFDLAVCITLPETPTRRDECWEHLTKRGVNPLYLRGICGKTFGLLTTHCYEIDHPGSGYRTSSKHVGLHLSHYLAWTVCQYDGRDSFLILEDDAEFPCDWRQQFSAALKDAPPDWDMLFVGSGNCADKPKEQIANTVWKVTWPQCTHAYLVRSRALNVLLETQRHVWAPIDLSLIFRSFPKLNVYTVLPRIVTQRHQDIAD